MLSAPLITGYLSEHYAEDDYRTVAGYRARGGFEGLAKALRLEPGEITETVASSGLRGRGGAGCATGIKWGFMPERSDRPKLLVCNGDESEPGSFKDRLIIERAPLQVIEGLLIAARATGAAKSFIYVRGEYALAIERLSRAVAECYERGWLGPKVGGKRGFAPDNVGHPGAGPHAGLCV